MIEISVLMPCHNRSADLLRVLRSYDMQNGDAPFELVAVDDGSTDATLQVLGSYRPQRYCLHVVRLEKNQGPSVARNRAIPQANSPLVLFVGDDILPEINFIEAHLAAHRHFQRPEVAILGLTRWPDDLPVNTLMAHIDGVGQQQFSYHFIRENKEYDYRHFYTSNISLRKDLLTPLERWFDPDFPYAGFEDAELSYRLSNRGMRILYSSAPLAYHYHPHNIHTFAIRQYKTGQMACILVRKHPELASQIYGRKLYRLRLLLGSLGRPLPEKDINRVEEAILRVGSDHEWVEVPWLDTFYFRLLDYYYQKGVADGLFEGLSVLPRIRGTLAARFFSSFIPWLIPNLEKSGDMLAKVFKPKNFNLRKVVSE
jgi:glycosyltransferase involved in cell wall biosynthesis